MWSLAKTEMRGFRELFWLAAMTVSVTWMSSYLIDIDSPDLAWQFCAALQIFAWVTIFLGWRRYKRARGGHMGLYLLALAVDILIVGQLRAAWFPCPLRPEVAAYSTLCAAVRSRDLKAVRASLARYPVPDFRNEASSNYCRQDQECWESLDPLSAAVHLDDVPIATELLAHGAVAAGSDGQNDPMGIAAATGSVPMMRLLLHRGAQLDDSTYGDSPLWNAATGNHPSAVAFLLHLGANPHASGTNDGARETILEYAQQHGFTEIADMIRHSGGRTKI